MKIKVGYDYSNNNENKQNLIDLFFRDWLYSHCSASVDNETKEIVVNEEEYVWLVFAYPASYMSKFVSIDFDNHQKEQRNGHTRT